MIKRLDLSLGRTILASSLLALAALLALDLFFVAVGELDELGKGRYDAGLLFLHLALRAPARAEALLPVSVLLGSLIGLGGLARQGELTAWRAAGVSVTRILLSVLGAGLVLMALAALLGETLAPDGERYAQALKHQAQSGQSDVVREGRRFWLRDGETLARVEGTLPDGSLHGITLYTFADGRLLSAGHAARAQLGEGLWRLEGWRETRFDGRGIRLHAAPRHEWRNGISPAFLDLARTRPAELDARELTRYIAYLDHNGLDSRGYALAFWQRLARPFAGLAMLILAVPFVFGPLRDAQSGRRLLVGAVIGIVYMVADRMLGQLALVYGIAPLLSALLPAALCALLGITMLVRIERLSAPRIQSVSAADGVSAGGPKGKGVAGMAGQSIRWERAKKPEKCPACGASPVAEILYGYYGHSPELEQDVEEGRITFGGCIVEDDDPDWKCTHCGAKIHQKQGPDVDPRII